MWANAITIATARRPAAGRRLALIARTVHAHRARCQTPGPCPRRRRSLPERREDLGVALVAVDPGEVLLGEHAPEGHLQAVVEHGRHAGAELLEQSRHAAQVG